MARPLLSICMIVKNEEAVLAKALASTQGIGAEIVLVDTGSTDRTVEIAKSYEGVVVHHFAWVNDFSAARNFGFSKATGEWLFVLDADEELTPEMRAEFARVLGSTTAAALRVPVVCVDDQGGVQITMMSERFVRNGFGYEYEGRVHESMTANVLRKGGRIDDTQALPMLHHGYTAAESARKDRRTRNRILLEAAIEAAPEEPRYWHYLGIELRMAGDLEGAATLFDRVLTKAPDHDLAAWSASSLGAIHEAERDFGTAWAVTETGLGGVIGRIGCLVQIGKIAVREGDAATAMFCANEIERAPGDDLIDRATSLERAAELRAAAEPRSLAQAMKKYPRNTVLAEMFVKGKPPMDAVRANNAPAVVAAAMTSLHRAGNPAKCVELGEKSGVRNETWAFALARVGRLEEAKKELLAFGDNAAPLAIVFGLAYGDDASIERGLGSLGEAHRDVVARVKGGTKVPAKHAWIVRAWMELAIGVREDEAVTRLASTLPWTVAERAAFCALATYEQDPMAGLNIALAHPVDPGAYEVIGLVAHAHGDFPAAATMLSMRAKAGDASVRVYLKAADAYGRMGRKQESEAMLAMGRDARPLSKAFQRGKSAQNGLASSRTRA